MITPEQIQEMKLAAEHCDDFTQYKREIREIERLESQHGIGRATTQVRNRPSHRRHTGRRTASSIGNAIAMMEGKA